MPLPFLTADRDGGELATATAAVPTSYETFSEDTGSWRRPYRPGPWRVGGAALLLLVSAAVLVAALVVAFAGSLPGAGICVAVAALVTALAVRIVRTGIWVSARGLRQLRPLSTTTLSWAEVAGVRTVRRPVRRLGVLGAVEGQALVVERVAGEPLRPLVTEHGGDFLGRPQAFATAIGAVEGWVADFTGGADAPHPATAAVPAYGATAVHTPVPPAAQAPAPAAAGDPRELLRG
ncbi:hypothetical protein AB0K09_12215 [Streptomyces sp. NPDC049577]|uniref:hypothetical protein n=1 Tax=Streptomyces sp. NPDC049577 TaxID=3155153 RepID=UPI00342F7173